MTSQSHSVSLSYWDSPFFLGCSRIRRGTPGDHAWLSTENLITRMGRVRKLVMKLIGLFAILMRTDHDYGNYMLESPTKTSTRRINPTSRQSRLHRFGPNDVERLPFLTAARPFFMATELRMVSSGGRDVLACRWVGKGMGFNVRRSFGVSLWEPLSARKLLSHGNLAYHSGKKSHSGQ
jgi:hypothetical protein